MCPRLHLVTLWLQLIYTRCFLTLFHGKIKKKGRDFMLRRYELTDCEWEAIKDFLPPEKNGKHSPPSKDNRMMLNGMG